MFETLWLHLSLISQMKIIRASELQLALKSAYEVKEHCVSVFIDTLADEMFVKLNLCVSSPCSVYKVSGLHDVEKIYLAKCYS